LRTKPLSRASHSLYDVTAVAKTFAGKILGYFIQTQPTMECYKILRVLFKVKKKFAGFWGALTRQYCWRKKCDAGLAFVVFSIKLTTDYNDY
jgi:hypothetical protein